MNKRAGPLMTDQSADYGIYAVKNVNQFITDETNTISR